MHLIELLIVIAIIGVIAWAINTYVPLPNGIKIVIYAVAIIGCCLYALHAFGIALP